MAVRFNAFGEQYTADLSLGPVTNWSITGWFKLSANRGDYSTFWSFTGADENTYRILQTDSDGRTLLVYPVASSDVLMTVGAWYFVGVSASGANGTIRMRAEGAGSFTGNTWSTGTNDQVADVLSLGESVFGNEWVNGSMAALKLWMGTTLSVAELEAEYQYRTPLKTAGITCNYIFDTASTVDNSGNGFTLSGGTGVTTEAGPALIDVPGSGGSVINGWGRVPAF